MSKHLPFTPVPVRPRRDGWTPERQAAFIAALASTRSVAAAARAVGLSFQTAYRLRARADAESFVAAWDAALTAPPLKPDTTGRALGGVARPINYRGRQVGEHRRYDDRLAIHLLRLRMPDRFGAAGTDLAQALTMLKADLAAGVAPSDQDGPPADVSPSSSPSEPGLSFLPCSGKRGSPAGLCSRR